jgi:uncharacterized protein with FMN-binding domain
MPDAEEAFSPYQLSVTVRILDGCITEIFDVKILEDSDETGENAWFLQRAENGTSKKAGVLSQILAQQSADADGIDAVTGATCSSKAILDAVADALQQAELETEGRLN